MQASPKAAFAAIFVAALCAFAPVAASAQGRDNVYAVGGIQVDETAASAASAQQAGFTAAQREGFERLVRRLAPQQDLLTRGVPPVEGPALDALVQSVDVEQERRSNTRYIGRLTVRFNPDAVRATMRQYGLSVVDARGPPVLVAPLVGVGVPDEAAAVWREVWTNGGFGDELAPMPVAPPDLRGAPSWDAASSYAASAAAASVLYATLRIQGADATASLVEVNAAGSRPRGDASARIGGTDAAALRAALQSLAEQASSRVQNDWKASVAANGGQRARISASAIYTDQHSWETIKEALEGAAHTLISEIRIEAVGRDGALVSFSFVGDRNQLVAELARRGVTLQDTSTGPTLQLNGNAPARPPAGTPAAVPVAPGR
jgi:hypothetical protein